MKTNMIATAAFALLFLIVAACPSEACPTCKGPAPFVPSTPTYKPPSTSKPQTCPKDIYLKLNVCSPLLEVPLIGSLADTSCCNALLGLAGVDLEVCLCLAIDANVLGIIDVHAKIDAVVKIFTACKIPLPKTPKCP